MGRFESTAQALDPQQGSPNQLSGPGLEMSPGLFYQGGRAAELLRIHRTDERLSVAAFITAVDTIAAAVRSLYRMHPHNA